MTRTFAIDMHVHLVPARSGALRGFDGVEWSDIDGTLTIDGHPIGATSLFDADALIEWMDRVGVETAWISPPPPTYRPQLDAEEAGRWCDALHAGLEAMAGIAPDRLAVMRLLPVAHPRVAAQIVRRHTGRNLFTMSTGGAGLQLSDPDYDPLWQALDEFAAAIFLHPGEGCDGRLDRYYLHNLVGNPSETGLAMGHLAFAGVLGRHPHIHWLLAHGGGTLPVLLGRMQRGWDTARPGINRSLPGPADQVARISCDCITHSRAGLKAAMTVFGREAILFGSDWPFPMGVIDPDDQFAAMDPQDIEQIASNSRILADQWQT